MNKRLRQLMQMYSLALFEGDFYNKDNKKLSEEELKEMERELKQKKKENYEKQQKNRGLEKFNIKGQEIWALNKKNAIKKVNKNK